MHTPAVFLKKQLMCLREEDLGVQFRQTHRLSSGMVDEVPTLKEGHS